MNTIIELIGIVAQGLSKFTPTNIAITIGVAIFLSALCWWICNNYVMLWNKRFRVSFRHQLFSVFASILTFLFVLAFAGLSFMKEVALAQVSLWKENIRNDKFWQSTTFNEASDEVKKLDIENPNNFTPTLIPTTKPLSVLTAAKIYASGACKHFDEKHSFLSKIIWTSAKIPIDLLEKDIKYYQKNINNLYPPMRAVDIAAEKIKTDLEQQTPRTVSISRIALVLLFFFVQLIPFGLIGYAAYKDIRSRT